MLRNLSEQQLIALIEKVFAPAPDEKRLSILVDVPDGRTPDTPLWQDRRRIAAEWYALCREIKAVLGIQVVDLLYYQNSGSNNADFPQVGFRWTGPASDADFDTIQKNGAEVNLEEALRDSNIVLVPTQFSATAPLKLRAAQYGFKAASMPGFSRAMIPALGLDFDEVHEHVMRLKERLDIAEAIEIHFVADQHEFDFFVDIRHRKAAASSGLLRQPGSAGNLPSGEAYIVPFEGNSHARSETHGRLPVQFGSDLVIYQVEENRAINVFSSGAKSKSEKEQLTKEPAYGNIAEVGFGVLHPFGVAPVGEVLLDEKLGLHVAFGRSDHFGGSVGPGDFNDPRSVVHIDRVYIPEIQDRVLVRELIFVFPGGKREMVMKNSRYTI